VHGIPSPKTVLSEGDIISIDLGAKMGGFFGDSAVTVGVGRIERQAADLLRVTEESLWKAIEAVRPGARVSDIGYAVQSHVEKAGFRSCASSSGTASDRSCTKSRRFRTTETRAADRGWRKAWCWRSSRW
jgi:methionine aminopeptidase